ncbi:MAG: YkgJ family cysteine cluster protein [Methanomicrobiaceae archaeon]|nr:YkgJ family cysteine cluster protein [Methanomicrobiaceae archaeon]
MLNKEYIAGKIKKTGFQCKMCGECCTNQSEDSNLVLVSAQEIRAVIEATGMEWDDIAEPYPETFTEKGCICTFAWCLRRKDRQCIFLDEKNKCRIYQNRPWICRTYPFMLTEDDLIVSECRHKGYEISDEEAILQADELIERKEKEDMDYKKIERIFAEADLKKKKFCVIDSEGVKEIG